jgi:hypothetical protein
VNDSMRHRKHYPLGADPGTPKGVRLLTGVLDAEWHSHGLDGPVRVLYTDSGGRQRELMITEEVEHGSDGQHHTGL